VKAVKDGPLLIEFSSGFYPLTTLLPDHSPLVAFSFNMLSLRNQQALKLLRNPLRDPFQNLRKPLQVREFTSSSRSCIIATMASKFMVNAAFESRLLLRPSHQRTVFGRPTLPILTSRSYSDSPSTPSLPKTSGSTEGSQSSGPKYKNWFHPEAWTKGKVAAALATIAVVCASSFLCAPLKHADYQRLPSHMPPRKSGNNGTAIGTRHLKDVYTNLHANLKSLIS